MTLPPCPIAGHDNPHHWHEHKQKNKQIGQTPEYWHVDHRDGVPGIVCTERGGLSRCYSAHVPESTEPAPTGEPCCCNINCGDYCDKCHGAPGEWRCKRHRREFGDMPTPTAPDLEVPPDAPSLVTLPTVDEIADVIHGEWALDSLADRHRTYAVSVLALLESRVPHWVRIEPGDIRPGMRVHWERDGNVEGSFTVDRAEDSRMYYKDGYAWVGMDYVWYVDPRTIPTEPKPTPAEKLAEALCATYAPDGDEPAWTPANVLAALDAAGLTLTERGEK